MFKINNENLYNLFDAICKKEKLYIPVDSNFCTNFKLYSQGDKLSNKLNTDRSAKDFFFPQTENLVDFKTDKKKIEVVDVREELEDFIIFGVRACDLKSFEILDKVFLKEPIDTYYKNRREHGLIITRACLNPEKTCFCKTFSIDPTNPLGDIEVFEGESEFFFNPKTQKGENFIEEFKNFFKQTEEEKINQIKKQINDNYSALPLANLKAKDFTKDQLEIFNSNKWDELSESCLGCGSCTFVCPTCQCYDIKDFNTGKGIKRFRCWDSCMYSDFTLMAGGNPRLTQMERFRQRFMHKLVYYPINNDGLYSCVGCGRCLKKCPISMNIVKVIKSLGEEN